MLENIWQLIVRTLSNEANSQEKDSLKKLSESDSSVQEAFDETQEIWNKLSPNYKEYNKKRIQQLVDLKIQSHEKIQKRKRINTFLRIAAALSGLAFILFFSYTEYNRTVTYSNNTSSVKEIILPDNSIILLNKKSKLTHINSIFRDFDRRVEVQGEAFFKISKTIDKQQFKVSTSDFEVTVLGTQFNVRCDKNFTSIMLTEGKISIDNFTNPKLEKTFLNIGQIAIYSKTNKKLQIKETNQAIHTAWLSDRLLFDDFNIYELAEMLRLLYGKELVVEDPELRNKRISGSAPTDDLSLVIKALKIILKTEIIEKQDSIIVK